MATQSVSPDRPGDSRDADMTVVTREPISSLCERVVVGHVGPSSEHRSPDGIPFLMGKNVGEGFLKLQDLERVTLRFHEAQKKSQLDPGDVVVVRIGQSGQAAKIPDDLGPANCAGLVVIKQPSGVDPDYLVRYLNSPAGRQQSLSQVKGSTRQTLNTRSIATTVIPVLPVWEQRRITEVLDRVDALRTKRRAAVEKLEELRESIFIDMFGESRNFQRTTLGDVADLKRGPFGGALKKEIFVDVGYLVYEQRNAIEANFTGGRYFVTAEKFQQMATFAVRPSDLIVSCSGTLGRVAEVPEGAPAGIINQALLRVRPRKSVIRSLYLKHVLQMPSTQRELSGFSHGTGLKNFPPMKDVKALTLALPPLETQDEYARHVSELDRCRNKQLQSLDHLEGLFSSLNVRAFARRL